MVKVSQRFWLTTDRVDTVIDASAESLYAMVSDLPRIGEWSPECEGVTWEGEVSTPVVGTTFIGQNAVGPGRRIRYKRHGRVLVADPGREFEFITDEGGRESTVWRYQFQPRGRARASRSRTTFAGFRCGRASSMSPPTATKSCSRTCARRWHD